MSLKSIFQSADNNRQNGSKTYWFEVSFVCNEELEKMILGVVESGSDEPSIVNDESYPIAGSWFECYVSDLQNHVTNEIRETLK